MNFKNEMINWKKEAKELLNENQVDLITKYMFLEQQCKKQKEVIDKIRKEISEEHSIMGVEVVENWVLEDILKEVE